MFISLIIKLGQNIGYATIAAGISSEYESFLHVRESKYV